MSRAILALSIVLLASVSAPLRAQPSPSTEVEVEVEAHPPADVARARTLYAEGLAAIDDGRWADALGAFATSYDLSGAPPALFNVALVLRGLGRMREARDTLDRLGARMVDGETSIAQVAAAMRAEAAARVAVIALEGLPELGSGRVLWDGVPLTYGAERPFHLEVDPGDHTLSVLLTGYEPFGWQGMVADGARTSLEVRLVPIADVPIWPWLVGGGALLAVGAVILGVVLGTQSPSLSWPTLPHID